MKKIHVLLLENDPEDAFIVQRKLDGVATVDIAITGEMFREMVAAELWDVVLVDFDLPGYSGKQAIALLKELHPDTPAIIVTGSMNYAAAVNAMRLGFVDCHEKHQLDRLADSVQRAHEMHRLKDREIKDNRFQLLGETTTGYCHDLNNILQVFAVGTDILPKLLLKHLNPIPDEILHVLGAMSGASKRGTEMSRQMMTFVRGTDGKTLKAVSPEFLLTELRQMVSDTFPKEINLSCRAMPGTAQIACDSTQIIQVLLNLCVNARYAMPHGGELQVGAQNISQYGQREQLSGDFVMFSVRDTGTGIPPDVLPKIFDYLFTTKPPGEGLGLGLSLAQRIVRDHGGDIEVKTSPAGTTFHVYLPAMQPEKENHAVPLSEEFDGRDAVVLIVDDEASMRMLMQMSLRDVGYKTLTASCGIEALSYFRHGTRIDLLLSDIMMPLMGGVELAGALRAQSFSLPIVFVTGRTDVESFDPMPTALLRKPFSRRTLLETMAKVLSAPKE